MEGQDGAGNSPIFINYNSLAYQDRLQLAHSGLDRIIGIAAHILESRLGKINLYDFHKPYYDEQQFWNLNSLVAELLELIGSYERFGHKATQQDRFFRKPGERTAFPVYLHISRISHMKKILSKNSKFQKIIERNSPIVPAFSKQLFKGVSTAHKVTYGPSEMNESETKAIAALYMVELTILTLTDLKNNAMKEDLSTQLTILMDSALSLYSLFDASETFIAHSSGGKTGKKKEQFEDSEIEINKILRKFPDLTTSLVFRKVKKELKDNAPYKMPSDRWILDKIRILRKKNT